MKFIDKIRRKLIKLRLKPIRVFCFHHVCCKYDPEGMNVGDWMQLDEFKQRIFDLRSSGTEFISLTEAYKHITNDVFRCRKYAVITFDDGYASLKEVLPWLEQQEIPTTLFVNGKYLDGVSYRNNQKEKYLTKDELFTMNSRFIEVGHHGWEHNDATRITAEEFMESVKKNIDILSKHSRYIPFWAYTWGNHNNHTDSKLSEYGIVPVLMDGVKNYNDKSCISRKI